MFDHGSKARLTARDLGRFDGASLFDRIGRAACRAGCLPRKELFEAWEMARRVRRQFRGGRVVDVAGGHGMLAHILLLLDDSSPNAAVVDPNPPASAAKLHKVIEEEWPRLAGRVSFARASIDEVEIESGDLVVSSHACGALTDRVIARAANAGARLAVLPCCHDLDSADAAALSGWVDGALAIDIARATRLQQRGYRTWTQTIPSTITPKNRLLLGSPISSEPA